MKSATWMMRIIFTITLFLSFSENLHAACFGLIYLPHIPNGKIEGPFVKAMQQVHKGLIVRGCKASDIKVLVGNGQAIQNGMFLSKDIKSKLTTGPLEIALRVPGSPLLPGTTQNVETAILNVGHVAKAGDIFYVHIIGHAYSKTEIPSYDDKILNQEFGQWLSLLPTTLKTRLFFDVCYAGGIMNFIDSPSVCAFTSTSDSAYAKYSFTNMYSYQLGLALQDPKNSMLQIHLQATRRDITVVPNTSSLQQLIQDSTGGFNIETIKTELQTESKKSRTYVGELINAFYSQPQNNYVLNSSRSDYTNPLLTLKSMLSYDPRYLINKHNQLRALKKRSPADEILKQDIEMALRLQYLKLKGSIFNKKRLQEVATCMDEKL